jgi:hypothetical protein
MVIVEESAGAINAVLTRRTLLLDYYVEWLFIVYLKPVLM